MDTKTKDAALELPATHAAGRRRFDTLRIEGHGLVWKHNDHQLRIEAWGPNSLRVRATKSRRIETEQDWALLAPAHSAPTFVETDYAITLSNGDISATVDMQGRVSYHNGRGELLVEELWRQRDTFDPFWTVGPGKARTISALQTEGREIRPEQGDAGALTVRFEANEGEQFFGMGQYQQAHLDLKGCTLELAQRNSQASVPFTISSRGYGFLWNNPAIGEVAFARNETRWHARSTRQMDYWITAADTPRQILGAYMEATGKPPMMPDYALGLWQCKLRYRTQSELLEVAREYKRRGLNLSVIVIDFFHWTNQGDWRFDPRDWPDVRAMTDELHAMGIRLMVSIWPTVDSRTENFRIMSERGLLVQTNRGIGIQFDCLGNLKFFDATHPEAQQYIWSEAKQHYADQGVDLFWLDEAEPEYSVYDFENYRYHLGQVLEVGNIYPKLYSKAFYDGQHASGKTEIVNLVRCAWAGSQRYGALVWSGDIHSSFHSMRNQLSAGLNMAMAGIPWWTMDIGGFHGGDIRDPDFHELMIRWFQWAVFTPILRMHGHRDPFTEPDQAYRDGIAQFNTGAGNELWSFGEPVYHVLERFLRIRERLKPYIRELMREAHEDGTPLMRPMFYVYPDQAACWNIHDQYLFGEDLLVAPVTQAGQTARKVYLPNGSHWMDAFTGKQHAGGAWIDCELSIDSMPVFVRTEARNGAQLLAHFLD